MGAWGVGSFENDTALDFVESIRMLPRIADEEGADEDFDEDDDELNAPDRTALIVMAILQSAGEDGDDADIASSGIVAAEVIAAMRGWPAQGLDEAGPDLTEWVKQARKKPIGDERSLRHDEVRDHALRCLKVVLKSELAELWSENKKDAPAWRAMIKDLEARLSKPNAT